MLKLISFAVFLFLALACSKSTSDLVLGSWGDSGDKITFMKDGTLECWERDSVHNFQLVRGKWVKRSTGTWAVVDDEIHCSGLYYDLMLGEEDEIFVCKIDAGPEGEVKFLMAFAFIKDGVRHEPHEIFYNDDETAYYQWKRIIE